MRGPPGPVPRRNGGRGGPEAGRSGAGGAVRGGDHPLAAPARPVTNGPWPSCAPTWPWTCCWVGAIGASTGEFALQAEDRRRTRTRPWYRMPTDPARSCGRSWPTSAPATSPAVRCRPRRATSTTGSVRPTGPPAPRTSGRAAAGTAPPSTPRPRAARRSGRVPGLHHHRRRDAAPGVQGRPAGRRLLGRAGDVEQPVTDAELRDALCFVAHERARFTDTASGCGSRSSRPGPTTAPPTPTPPTPTSPAGSTTTTPGRPHHPGPGPGHHPDPGPRRRRAPPIDRTGLDDESRYDLDDYEDQTRISTDHQQIQLPTLLVDETDSAPPAGPDE